MNWKGIASWLVARLNEPSTYAGFAALAVAAGYPVDAGVLAKVTAGGIGLAGAAAIILAEKAPASAVVKPA